MKSSYALIEVIMGSVYLAFGVFLLLLASAATGVLMAYLEGAIS